MCHQKYNDSISIQFFFFPFLFSEATVVSRYQKERIECFSHVIVHLGYNFFLGAVRTATWVSSYIHAMFYTWHATVGYRL